jgi:hypothetical protein
MLGNLRICPVEDMGVSPAVSGWRVSRFHGVSRRFGKPMGERQGPSLNDIQSAAALVGHRIAGYQAAASQDEGLSALAYLGKALRRE